MKITEIFRQILKHFLDQKPRGFQGQLADTIGITRKHLNDYLGERRQMNEEYREQIAKYFGYEYEDFIVMGRRLLNGIPIETQTDHELTVKVQTNHEKDLLGKTVSDYRGVPLYESGRLAAWSNGAAFDHYEKPTSEVIVYTPELKHRATHNLVAFNVGGDSMEPLIPQGAIVIIDKDDKEFSDNKIFAVCVEEGGVRNAAVKRVRKFKEAKGFVLWSENDTYPPVLVTEQDWPTLCIGRVVWMWRSFECF